MEPFKLVKEFHEAFGLLIGRIPELPDEKTRKLRINLLREEFEEYLEAEANNDLVGIVDALADIQYIVNGTAVSYGADLDEVFLEVHKSNMSKLGSDGKPLYREDGKVLKGPKYFAPRIKALLLSRGYRDGN